MRPQNTIPCECSSAPSPYLVFDKSNEDSIVKSRIESQWQQLKELDNALLFIPPAQEGSEDENLYENEELGEHPEENNEYKELFEKMLALRMDQHALAIADGYRTRPQVCTCESVCCNCFDYTQFLHNLNLHKSIGAVAKLFGEVVKDEQDEFINEPYVKLASEDQSKLTVQSQSKEIVKEQSKEAAMSSGSEQSEIDVNRQVVKWSHRKLSTIPNKDIIDSLTRYESSNQERKITVVEVDNEHPKRTRMKKNEPEPPYETIFNSIHRRVRRFDPNSYKFLVKQELRKLNGLPPTQVKDLKTRSRWKI